MKKINSFLTVEQLQKLNTKRLLSLLKSLNKPITTLEKYGPYGLYSYEQDETEMTVYLPKLKQYKQDIKDILKTREHIEKGK